MLYKLIASTSVNVYTLHTTATHVTYYACINAQILCIHNITSLMF